MPPKFLESGQWAVTLRFLDLYGLPAHTSASKREAWVPAGALFQIWGLGLSVLQEENREGILERLARVLVWIAGGLILACAVLVTLDVFAREFFNDNFFESFEITIYTYAVTVAFSFAFALTSKTHIRIDVIYGRLPSAQRALLDIAAMSMLAGLAVVLAFYAWSTTKQSFGFPGPGRLGPRRNRPPSGS